MSKNKKKSIKLNAVLNSIRTISNLIFPLITYPYITRTLAVGDIGKYDFSQSIVYYFSLIAALGIDKYAVREGAKYRDDREAMSRFASGVFSLNIVSTLVAYIALFIYLAVSKKSYTYRACILISSLQIFFTTIGTEWIYNIFEEYNYITIRSLVFKVISIALLFLFVRKPGDYLKYTLISVFSSICSNTLNFLYARKFCNIKFTLKFNWKRILKPVMIIFASNIAISIYVSSDTTMLGYMKGDYAVGIYGISSRIYGAVKPVLAAALTVTIPRMALYAGKNKKKEYDNLMKKVFNALFLIMMPCVVGLILLSRDAVLIIGGTKFLASQTSLRILSLALFFSLFSALFDQCALLPYHREKYILMASISGAIENIVLNIALIPLLAENGAAITTVLAEVTTSIMNYYHARDIVKKAIVNKDTVKNIATVCVGVLGIVLICLILKKRISTMAVRIFLQIILSGMVYGGILIALKNPVAKDVIITLREKRNGTK